jgi:hypothetical protein
LILYNDSTIRAIGSEMHGQKKLGQMGWNRICFNLSHSKET